VESEGEPTVQGRHCCLSASRQTIAPAWGAGRMRTVLVQVSSMKTSRAGSILQRYLHHCMRRRTILGRTRSAAISVFFVAELLAMDELPHRTVIDFQSPLGQLGDCECEVVSTPISQVLELLSSFNPLSCTNWVDTCLRSEGASVLMAKPTDGRRISLQTRELVACALHARAD